jgi:hypothetical protein
MSEAYAWLKPSHMIEGFRIVAEVHGTEAGAFWRGLTASEHQVAVHYRQRGAPAGVASLISVYWDPEPHQALVGTTDHAGQPVTVNGKHATYHDGTWMPGPGLDEIKVLTDGKAHWGRDFLHSLTMSTPKGVFAVRCPYALVPRLDQMVRIFSSISALS